MRAQRVDGRYLVLRASAATPIRGGGGLMARLPEADAIVFVDTNVLLAADDALV